ncbi:PQQ-binding-like beta-propeller repeat protein [Botrimarina sp.]|uniref:outer membrane protein assembly factor BamB family protein n=1 Tax=Botrimarina sp. TaxID=2795802 RepID=UPI0032EB73AD
MPPPTRRCLPLTACAVAAAIVSTGLAQGEIGEPRWLGDPPQRTQAASAGPDFQPASVSSQLRRALLRYEALVADAAWDDAIELVEALQAEHGEELAAAEEEPPAGGAAPPFEGHSRFVPLHQRCQQLLADLPPEGRDAYLQRVGATARRRVDEAIARLDAVRLELAVREFFATPACHDALLALGELALERGDTCAARRAYNRLTPFAWGPHGRPAGVAMSQIDPDVDPQRLAAAWREAERPRGLPTVSPSGDEASALVADAIARLALVAIREGDPARAEAETLLLEALAPEAEGRLAGRRQPLAPALRTLAQSELKATSMGATASQRLHWAWDAAAELPEPAPEAAAVARNQALRQQIIIRGGWPAALRAQTPASPVPDTQFVATERYGYYVADGALMRVDLAGGGTSSVEVPGLETAPPEENDQPGLGDLAQGRRLAPAQINVFGGGRLIVNGRVIQLPQRGAARRLAQSSRERVEPGLSLHDGVLYARITKQTFLDRRGRAPQAESSRLIGLDLDDEARIVVEVKPPAPAGGPDLTDEAALSLAGPPEVRGDRLYVVLVRSSLRTDFEAACYDSHTGRALWRTPIGSGEASQQGDLETAPGPILLAGDTLYVSTNSGALAALDAASGGLRWLACYPRRVADQQAAATPRPWLAGDRVIVAPADSDSVIAYDAGTGRPVWTVTRSDPGAAIVGLSSAGDGRQSVVVAGRQVAAYDSLTGEARFVWPQSRRSGLRGLGVAALHEGELFWPTRETLYTLDPSTGELTRSPIDLRPLGAAGASISPTPAGLLVAGVDRFRLLSPVAAEPDPTAARLNSRPTAALAESTAGVPQVALTTETSR